MTDKRIVVGPLFSNLINVTQNPIITIDLQAAKNVQIVRKLYKKLHLYDAVTAAALLILPLSPD